jgi:hypothetical protein
MATPYQLAELVATRLSSLTWPTLHVADLAGIQEQAQVAPAFNIIPAGIAIADDGEGVSVKETITLVAVVRFSNQPSGAGARIAAGPMLAKAEGLLTGWQPSTGHTPMAIETPPPPQFSGGFGYYPLQFSSNYDLTE